MSEGGPDRIQELRYRGESMESSVTSSIASAGTAENGESDNYRNS